MAINFPDSPANGATYTVGTTTWTYYTSSSSWRAGTSPAINLPSVIAVQNTTSTAYAIGANSIAIGTAANTTGANGISVGTSSNTVGANSISLGSSSAASGNNSLAFGPGVVASAVDAVAVGSTSLATANQATAIGSNTVASWLMSSAFGSNGFSNATMSLALGANAQATAAYAVALGANVISSTANTIVIGTNTHYTVIPGGTTLSQSSEVLNTISGATGVVTHDFSTGSIFYHTSISANFTANFTNVPTTDNRTNVVTLILVQSTTGYYPNAVQVNGSPTAIKWLGGSAPTATANRTELISFTLIRVGSIWVVTGSLSSYG